MARLVFVLGESGTGKSTSLRNLKKGEAQVVACLDKELPVRTDVARAVAGNYASLYKIIEAASAPIVVIDDLNYLMVQNEFNRAYETGYGKFTDFAVELDRVFKQIIAKKADQTFYVLAHPDVTVDSSGDVVDIDFKISAGKMSRKFPIKGLTNTVFKAEYNRDEGRFVFRVEADGTGIKSPWGMFESATVDNDLKAVDQTVRKFYQPITDKGDK